MPNPLLPNLGHIVSTFADARRRLLERAKAGDKEARRFLKEHYRIQKWVSNGKRIV